MFRWHIIRTLLYKEVLRYRYNWGLLVVVTALLALSGLVALSSRFSKLIPGQGGGEIQTCKVVYGDRPLSKQWAEYLRMHPPPFCKLEFDERPHGTPLQALVRDGELLVTLSAPVGPADHSAFPLTGWKIRYWCREETASGTMVVRDWLESTTADFLSPSPRIVVETKEGVVPAGTEKVEMMSTIVTAFAIFALYLLSFNLFITSTGEEREKKVLLGLLLSPAAPHEVLAAKAMFYATSSPRRVADGCRHVQPRLAPAALALAHRRLRLGRLRRHRHGRHQHRPPANDHQYHLHAVPGRDNYHHDSFSNPAPLHCAQGTLDRELPLRTDEATRGGAASAVDDLQPIGVVGRDRRLVWNCRVDIRAESDDDRAGAVTTPTHRFIRL